MLETPLPPPMLAAFLAASLVLAATPGPGVLFVVTRTLSQGRMAGLASVAGVALGNFGNAVGASLGLAAVFAVSSLAFTVVKVLGALYLLYLGWLALRGKDAQAGPAEAAPKLDAARIFRDGFWVALLNPKTAIFFAAFLPQFLDVAAPTMAQGISLGAIFVLIAACTDTAYVLAAARLAPAMERLLRGGSVGRSLGRLMGRYVTSGIFFGLGLFTLWSGSRAAK